MEILTHRQIARRATIIISGWRGTHRPSALRICVVHQSNNYPFLPGDGRCASSSPFHDDEVLISHQLHNATQDGHSEVRWHGQTDRQTAAVVERHPLQTRNREAVPRVCELQNVHASFGGVKRRVTWCQEGDFYGCSSCRYPLKPQKSS